MIVFESLWALFLLPLPLLVRWLGRTHYSERDSVRAPFFEQLIELSGKTATHTDFVAERNLPQKIMIVTVWLLLVLALARPVWLGDVVALPQQTRDFMVAVDISGSMDTEDVATGIPESPRQSRLDATRHFLETLIQNRQGDRMGLMVFGSAPYIQLPFSADLQLFVELLGQLQTRMAGPKTMLGDAIGLSIRHFDEVEKVARQRADASREARAQNIVEDGFYIKDKVLLLITDGNDSGSRVPVVEAARLAAERNITIHTLVIGDPLSTGEAAVDVDTLNKVSSVTHGQFFRVDESTSLQQVLAALSDMLPDRKAVSYFRPRSELFFWPLGAALIIGWSVHLWMLIAALGKFRNSKPQILETKSSEDKSSEDKSLTSKAPKGETQ